MTNYFTSITDLMGEIIKDCEHWPQGVRPWFRGEPKLAIERGTQLLPSLYRERHDEDQLLQSFRIKGSVFGLGQTPPRDGYTDQWLFLAQHHGLPTRLLDWSEGALIGLFFALQEDAPVLWMLNPIALNNLSLGEAEQLDSYTFKWTWVEHPNNIYNTNIAGAWQKDSKGTKFTVAVLTTYTHPRMSAQRSCFTVHGKCKDPLDEQVSGKVLRRYEVDPSTKDKMRSDLSLLGISHSTIFPDLDGLAKDLRHMY